MSSSASSQNGRRGVGGGVTAGETLEASHPLHTDFHFLVASLVFSVMNSLNGAPRGHKGGTPWASCPRDETWSAFVLFQGINMMPWSFGA